MWLIRHGQAEHNVFGDFSIRDPRLTRVGEEQAKAIPRSGVLPSTLEAENALIVCSPLRRTLETALLSLEEEIRVKGVPFLAHPDAQELPDHPCDTGSPASQLAVQYKGVDFAHLDEDWYLKIGPYSSSHMATSARIERLRGFLWQQALAGKRHIVLVTHHGVLKKLVGVAFENCEVRRYQLLNGQLLPAPPE